VSESHNWNKNNKNQTSPNDYFFKLCHNKGL